MKKILLIFSILFIGCDKQLDIDPATSVDAEQAKKSIDLILTGAYALIGSGPGTTGPNLQEGALYSTDLLMNADLLASEGYLSFVGTFDRYKEVSNKLMSSTNSSITRMWEKGYAAINMANTVLKIAPNADEGDQDYYKAQALFIRGIVHFELLRFWMEPSTDLGIPIVTEPTEDFNDIKSPERATIAASYAAIINDLTEAKNLLGDHHGVFANRYTAAAFLARIYLHQGNYSEALTKANEIIESEEYELVPVAEAFNTNGSPESIFEIQQNSQNNAGTSNDGITTFYSCDSETPGGASRGDLDIDPTFLDKFESDDKRLTELIYEGDCANRITSGKWRDPYANIPVIRLSEMYLIRAEANERLGSSIGDTPVNDVNAIRAKADASEYGSVDLEDILLERELELAFEGHRIHDFKRTEKEIVIDGETIKYTDPRFILPIPQSQINTNKNIIQNSYYR